MKRIERLHPEGIKPGRRQVRTPMQKMAIDALYRKPRVTMRLIRSISAPWRHPLVLSFNLII